MHLLIKAIFWFGLYAFLIILPLVTASQVTSGQVARPLLVELAVAAGFVGLGIICLEFVLISRVRMVAEPFGEDALLQFHRQMGILAFILVIAHPALLFLSGYPASCWLNPFASCANLATATAAVALYALLLLAVTSLWRKALRLNYEAWFVIHGSAALIAVGATLVHLFILGRYTHSPILQWLWVLYAALVLMVMFRYRVWIPLSNWSRRWEVTENRIERGDTRTLVVRPVGHDGFGFMPGQFAWLKTGSTPFGLGQHPISISSGADVAPGGALWFTIKNLGDWSGKKVRSLKPGDRLWVDGPYGVFSSDRQQAMGYVLIAGGVGITPLHSICDTMAKRGDQRPVLLFYGANSEADLMLIDELNSLQNRMNLSVIPVLANPGEGWQGERGFIDEKTLLRYLPPQWRWFNFMICGPNSLMDAMEEILPAMGVPPENVLSERFDMV